MFQRRNNHPKYYASSLVCCFNVATQIRNITRALSFFISTSKLQIRNLLQALLFSFRVFFSFRLDYIKQQQFNIHFYGERPGSGLEQSRGET